MAVAVFESLKRFCGREKVDLFSLKKLIEKDAAFEDEDDIVVVFLFTLIEVHTRYLCK